MKIRAKAVTTLALAGLVGGALSISPPLYAQDITRVRKCIKAAPRRKPS